MIEAVVVIGVLAVVAFVFSRGRAAGLEPAEFAAWKEVAARLDLSFRPGDLVEPSQLAGSWKGRAVVIELTAPPAGVLTVRAPSDTLLASGLLLRKEEGAAAIGKVAGLQDIQIGDKGLDDLLRIEGLGDERIKDLLTDARVRGPLGRLFGRHDNAVVERDHVAVHRRGIVAPPADLEAVLDAVVQTVVALDAASRDLSGSTLGLAPTAAPTLAPPTSPPTSPPASRPSLARAVPPTLEPVPHTGEIYEPLDTAEQSPAAPLRDATETLTDRAMTDLDYSDEVSSVAPVEDRTTLDLADDDETSPEPINGALVLLEILGDRSRGEREREDALAGAGRLRFEMTVDSVSRSTGALPQDRKRGRSVQGHVPGHVMRRVTVRFAAHRNAELDDLRWGATLEIDGHVVGWDDFTRRLTVDAV